MELTNVEVNRPQIHRIDMPIRVSGKFGARRVGYEIPRQPLEDYFPRSDLGDDAKRFALVRSNLGAIRAIMQRKCEQQARRETDEPGGSFWLLDFDPRDLDQQLSRP